ncbi:MULTISPECIES: bactofilin family protein [Oscillospiraceae]|uniref:Polymer-forming protein n=1 Tax=Harryflintia acetispora TaxID=1849041 RepID=A0A9X8UIB6_9FIRM|nr:MULTISPECIES: polymer-forming cytoskeletal protein [Oscillospiraceae]RGB66094.1 polymer-forming cytoskeletal protein [Harryflintia acetispora]TCL42720.1 polymer-forming protein [Harryflintia acetispora]
MGFKNDLTRAFRDLSAGTPQEETQRPAPAQPVSYPDYEVKIPTNQTDTGDYHMNSNPTPLAPDAGMDFMNTDSSQYNAEPTVVSANTVIKGDITTSDPLTVYGEVEGMVQCDNYLSVSGKIKGNTKGDKIVINKATIEGDVSCNNDFFVGEGTEIVGNVTAMSANIHGSVSGNITVQDEVVIGPTAVVTGDIATGSIEIKKGAFIKGSIYMESTTPSYPAAPPAAPAAPAPAGAGIENN